LNWNPGAFEIRELVPEHDVPVFHPWFDLEYASYWDMADKTRQEVLAFYKAQQASSHEWAWVGTQHGQICFLLECYDPQHHDIARHYQVEPGDIGMHFFVAPATEQRHGYTLDVMRHVMHYLFNQVGARRVVVEPDSRNDKVRALNRKAGFAEVGVIALKTKQAMLSIATRPAFDATLSLSGTTKMSHYPVPSAQQHLRHLEPEIWKHVNRHLVAKAIAEFSHEQILMPARSDAPHDGGHTAPDDSLHAYVLVSDDGQTQYQYLARPMMLRHWHVSEPSVTRICNGQTLELDALSFIIDFKETLAIPADKLPVYLDEISSTLYGAAYKRCHQSLDSKDLLHADYQQIEAAMTEGHPGFVANNGRIGFNVFDYESYTPETGSRFTLVWLAVHRTHAHFASLSTLEYDSFVRQELGSQQVTDYRAQLQAQGLEPDHYLFMPTHPWQWFNRLSIAFAADIAQRNIVYLGIGQDTYQAQQSIRTYFNHTDHEKCYVKTSLSILNMGFMRGLSPYYMAGTPAINEWLKQLIDSDPFLRQNGFDILQEVASIGYTNRYYEAALKKDSPYKKMLSVLWRESPAEKVQKTERLMTMASLLHRDRDGQALLPLMIEQSGLSSSQWLSRYFDAFLVPVVHCFYAYELVFMPHGENLIMVMDHSNVPQRCIMKDIAEESAILDQDFDIPEHIARLKVSVPEDYKILGIFIDIFDGVFRHMSDILHSSGCCSEEQFWTLAALSVKRYQQAHPALADKFARYDFFADDFRHSCLNRLQLKNNLQMVDLSDTAGSLTMAENLPNPVARFRTLSVAELEASNLMPQPEPA
jgi:siderophore synthetase component/RimJ/RimL family protein N-acetyltransferase